MLKFVYHLGVHKTASTLLQRNLAGNLNALRAQKVYYLNGEWPDGLIRIRNRLRRIENVTRETPSEDAMAFMNMRLVKLAAKSGCHTVIISEENFIGSPIHRQLSWGLDPAKLYPSAGECLKTLTWGISPKAVRIVLYTRKQDSLLRGHYSEALRVLATTDTFSSFLDQTELSDFRFDNLLSRLQKALPGAKIILKPFEAIKAGADTFTSDFLRTCGIDPEPLSLQTEIVNSALDADQAAELRELCARLRAGDKPRPIRIRAREINETPGNPANPIRIPASHSAEIRSTMQGDLSERLVAELP